MWFASWTDFPILSGLKHIIFCSSTGSLLVLKFLLPDFHGAAEVFI